MAMNIVSEFGRTGFGGFLPKIVPLFGLPFFFIGCYSAFGHILWDAYLRSKTHYTLTKKRTFIATDHPSKGKLLIDGDIDADMTITLKVGPLNSVFFQGARHGFKRIEDGRRIHKLMRKIQKDLS